MAIYELNPFTKQMERVDSIVPPASADVTGNKTLGEQDGYIPVDASTGQVNIQLTTNHKPGSHFYISKRDSSKNVVRIKPPAGKTINGQSYIDILYQYSTAHIACENDGNWSII